MHQKNDSIDETTGAEWTESRIEGGGYGRVGDRVIKYSTIFKRVDICSFHKDKAITFEFYY